MFKIFKCRSGLVIQDLETSRFFLSGAADDFDSLFDTSHEELVHKCRIVCKSDPLPRTSLPEDLLAPLGTRHRVHAAGVTYLSSKLERQRESVHAADAYARVYVADRPELFFKAEPDQVVAHGAAIRIREDSSWDVSEPELAVAFNVAGEILAYTICNDVSSRSIEGENPLYLPQAKLWDDCCALGPCLLVLNAGEELPPTTRVLLEVMREERSVFSGETTLGQMKRKPKELVSWLLRDRRRMFTHGGILSTGTGIIPSPDFTHQAGDKVSIRIEPIGTLSNTVVRGY